MFCYDEVQYKQTTCLFCTYISFTGLSMPYVCIGQRKVLKRKRSLSAPSILVSTQVPRAKHKQWTENQMKNAIEIVQRKRMEFQQPH